MKANELMIGDWVSLFQGNPDGSNCNVQVSYIGEYGEVGIDGCGEYTSANCHLLFPIPLTAEILEKNGFKNPTLDDPELINYVFKASFEYKSPLPNVKVLRVNYYDGVEWDFYVLLGERKSSDCGEQYEYVIIIKYVHELQHALWLAGIDITIEL